MSDNYISPPPGHNTGEAMRPLPVPLHERLQAEATRSKRPATRLAREAIEAWVEEREREVVREAIATYANEMAGTPTDVDSPHKRANCHKTRYQGP